MCSEAMQPDDDAKPREDEIVAEVRAKRKRLAAAVGYELQLEAAGSAEG